MGPPIDPAVLSTANITVVATVVKDPAWFFDIAVITSTSFVQGRVPGGTISGAIPADAIISSVIQRAQIDFSATGSPSGLGADGGTVSVASIGDTFFDTYIGTDSNPIVFSRELVTGGDVGIGFLLSEPIRTWDVLAQFGYGWGNAGLAGGSTGSLGVVVAISVDYTVIYTQPPPPPPPAQSGITQGSGPTGGGTTVEITGTEFVSGATVTFGGTPATSVVFNNSSSLTAVTPAHVAGTVDVVVTNPDAQVCTIPLAFRVYRTAARRRVV